MATEAEQYLEDGRYYRRLLVERSMNVFDLVELSGRDPEYVFSAMAFDRAESLHERAVTEDWSHIRIVFELWMLIARDRAAFLGEPGPQVENSWPSDESPFKTPTDPST